MLNRNLLASILLLTITLSLITPTFAMPSYPPLNNSTGISIYDPANENTTGYLKKERFPGSDQKLYYKGKKYSAKEYYFQAKHGGVEHVGAFEAFVSYMCCGYPRYVWLLTVPPIEPDISEIIRD